MNLRPGFMLYFEVTPALDILTDEEAGRLFRALMASGQYGELCELSGAAAVAFQMLRGRMDRDAETYREKCRKSAYATYTRDVRRAGGEPMPYEQWLSGDIGRYPTTTTTATATANATANANTIPDVIPNTAVISNTERKKPDAAVSTEFSTKTDGDTAWVLPFLDERERARKKRGGSSL